MATQLTPQGAGPTTGTDTLSFALGKNKLRASRLYKFDLKQSGSDTVADTLTVMQAASALSIEYTGHESISKSPLSQNQQVTFYGRANGSHLKCWSESPYVTIDTLTENSGGSAHTISATTSASNYAAVSNFQGGSTKYNFTIVVYLLANAPVSETGYAFKVSTADSETPGLLHEEQTFTIKVSSSPSEEYSLSIDEEDPIEYIWLGIGSSKKQTLHYTLDMPTGVTETGHTWSIAEGSSYASINSSTGEITGLSEGSAVVMISVTVSSGVFVSPATAQVEVAEDGTVSVGDISIGGTDTSALAELDVTNMLVSGTNPDPRYTVTSNVAWITSGKVDTQNSPYHVILNVHQNDGADRDNTRQGTVTVSGEDYLGQTQSDTFVVTQGRYYKACTSMDIYGDATINNSDNQATYTLTYWPSGTTESNCTWSIDGSGSTYAELSDETFNTVKVTAKSGASGNEITLRAENTYSATGHSIPDATKTITVTYVAPSANISIVDAGGNPYYNVRDITWQDTYRDHTNGAPRVVATNIQANSLYISGYTGFINSATLTTYNNVIYVETSFSQNNTSDAKSGSVSISALDSGGDPITPVTIQFLQAGRTTPDSIAITDFELTQVGGNVEVTATVAYQNGSNVSKTFSGLAFSIREYTSASDTGSDKVTGYFSDVQVGTGASNRVTVNYNKNSVSEFTWKGTLADKHHYTLDVNDGLTYAQTATYTIDDLHPIE